MKITNPDAHQLLKKFLAQKRNSVTADREYRSVMVDHVVHETREKFPELSIQQFFMLYKPYRIWPIPVSVVRNNCEMY